MRRNNNRPLYRVFSFFTSVKTAVVLIVTITGYAIISTIFPGLAPAGRWYRSPVFFLLSGLFTVNLAACTLYRIMKRIKTKAPRRFGPDIIHISLLILVLGGSLSAVKREEAFTYVRTGDTIELPGGEQVTVIELEVKQYEDGRPKDWYTKVRYAAENTGNDTGNFKEHTIEVNHPLTLKGYSFYQESFGSRPVAHVRITGQEDVYLREDEAIGILEFNGITVEGEAVFTLHASSGPRETAVLPGDLIAELAASQASDPESGEVRLSDIRMEHVSGLKIIRDPSFVPIIIAFVLLAIGLSVTFLQKIGDNR